MTAPMSEPEPASRDSRRRRLLYRATHRGTYENDILLGGFAQRHMDTLSEAELAALEALLELPDNELADWLTGRLPIPPEADTPMLRRVRDEALASPSSWPGLARPSTSLSRETRRDVDGRAKPGHDAIGERRP
jgi:antitoxin CptB